MTGQSASVAAFFFIIHAKIFELWQTIPIHCSSLCTLPRFLHVFQKKKHVCDPDPAINLCGRSFSFVYRIFANPPRKAIVK